MDLKERLAKAQAQNKNLLLEQAHEETVRSELKREIQLRGCALDGASKALAASVDQFAALKAENARLVAETTRLLDALIAAEYILGRVETITLKGDENPPKYHWGEAADLVHSTLYQHQLEYAASQPQKPEQSILSAAVDKARGGPTPPKEYQGFA